MEPRAAVLKNAFETVHMVFNAVTADMTDEAARYEAPGGTLPNAAAIIAHTLWGEDMVVNAALERRTLLESGRFAPTGMASPMNAMTPEFLAQSFDLKALREYADAVFANTSSGLETISAAALDRMLPTPLGTQMDAASFMASFGVVHVGVHTGDISALKGVQGLRGLPF